MQISISHLKLGFTWTKKTFIILVVLRWNVPRWPNSWCACLVCGRSRVRNPKTGQIFHSVANGLPPLQQLRK